MGNGRRFSPMITGLEGPAIAHNRCSARDRAVSRADDAHRTAPLPRIRMRSKWRAHDSDCVTAVARSNGGVFQAADFDGFVDSWPETLVPSASNRSTPEWTPVDSVDPPPRAIRLATSR
jgi:hypothetical protein